jgi:hypothetical protein
VWASRVKKGEVDFGAKTFIETYAAIEQIGRDIGKIKRPV